MAKDKLVKSDDSEIKKLISDEIDRRIKLWLKIFGVIALIFGLGFIPQVRDGLVTKAHNLYYHSADEDDIVAVYHSDFSLSKSPGDNGRNLKKALKFKAKANQKIKLYIETFEMNGSKKYLKLTLNNNPLHCLDDVPKAICDLHVKEQLAMDSDSGVNIFDENFNTLSCEFIDNIENFESINLELNISCIVFVYGKIDEKI